MAAKPFNKFVRICLTNSNIDIGAIIKAGGETGELIS